MAAVREDVVQIGFDIDFAELKKLTSELDDIKKTATSGFADDTFDEMTKDSKKAAQGIDDIKDGINGIKPDGVEDTVRGLRNTESEAKDAYGQLKKIANTGFDKAVSGLKKLGKFLGKVAIQAGKALLKLTALGAAGVAAIVTKSVMSYADYEQLVGGVDTLFKGSSKTVQKYADNAYKTAGLSANDYMSTVTSFSASLIQSLGGDTKKAAEYADMAIVDMSDNANKMGSDMGSIQDAYQGFAKQNYTMLDNLKLGYGGTQEEMKRLLSDAEAISGIEYDIKSYADVVEAIHVIQEDLGIAGTTAKEANQTISGSFASLKAAWANTLTSLVLGGDSFDRCVDNLVESAKTFGKNVMPAIVTALEGVGELISELAPIIEAELPGLIETLLPPLLKAATSLVKSLIVALPDIIGTLIDELPTILSEVWSAIKEAFGDIPGLEKVEAFFSKLKTFFENNAPIIKKVALGLVGLVAGLKLFNKIKGFVGLFGGGGKGGAGGGFFSGLAKMKPQTALKGMANLAIILGGLTILAAALMAVAPYIAKLSDLKSITKLLAVIGAIGLLGTAMANLAGKVGMIPVATVAKGLANIAIVMVGLGALAAVLMWVAPLVMKLGDIKSLLNLLVVIGAVGLVGSALAGLAGLIGMIPIVAVLSGLANIALALGGFTAIISAFGALSMIPGFNDFIANGGETLSLICGIIGDMAGSLVGGFAEGVTDSLPAIGENLSSFATSVKPMFDTFAGVDVTALSDFAIAFAAFIGVIAGEKLVSAITGGIDYAGLGTNLTSFAENIGGFFTAISTIPDGGLENATALFDCLAGISGLPKEGGVVSWFEGEVDYTKMATGLTQLAGAAGFFTAIEAIPEAAFTNATSLFDCLAGVSSLPKEGGIMSWFTGDIAYDSLATGLQSLTSEGMITALTTLSTIPETAYTGLSSLFTALAGVSSLPKDGGVMGWFTGDIAYDSLATGLQSLTSEGMITALTTLSTIPETAYTGLSSLFTALAGVSSLPKDGGVMGWFTGDSSTGIANVASQLPGIATSISSFFTNLGGVTDFTPISDLFTELGNIELNTDVAEGTGLFGAGASQLESMGTALANFASNASGFFTAVNGLNLANLSGFFDALADMGGLPDALSSLNASLGTALSAMVITVQTSMLQIKVAILTNVTSIITTFASLQPALYSSGVNMMLGLRNGMLAMLPALLATAASIAGQVSNTIDSALQIHSPSRVTYRSGVYTGEGIDLGMQSMIPDIKATAYEMGAAAIPYTGSYSPEADSTNNVFNSGGNSEYTTISPQFNLTVSGNGTQDERAMARKVKQWVREAFAELIESMERKADPAPREA